MQKILSSTIPFVPTGREALLGLLPMLKEAGTTYQNHRLFQDGEYAIMNNTVNNADAFGAKQIVSFNVYRTADGKIVEHCGVPVPIVENPVEGVTQFGGATEVKDLDKTDENKAAVTKLFNTIINGTQEEVGKPYKQYLNQTILTTVQPLGMYSCTF